MTMGVAFARSLRERMTDAERRLWSKLRMRQLDGHKFRRQAPLDRYILDFVCLEMRLVVEVDGGQHAESATDPVRTAFLNSRGFRVIRFWNAEVLGDMDSILNRILVELESPPPAASPRPPPSRGR
jgi:very-short-patch-repair endonuclease